MAAMGSIVEEKRAGFFCLGNDDLLHLFPCVAMSLSRGYMSARV